MKELDSLYQAIRGLQPTTAGGFEGLVRDVFAEVTGQSFRLMKSGPQGGVDILGDHSGTGLVIGIEGKHYAQNTKLPLDQLKSKVRDAVTQFPEMDLWTLAATRPLSQGDVKALEDVGVRDGIDVLVLDWDEKSVEPPKFAVLCAMAPVTIKARLGCSAELASALDSVRKHPSFSDTSERLRLRLQSPLVGYGAARTAMAQWLQSRMKNVESARMAFDSHATLLDSESHRISRVIVSGSLDQWWSTACTKPGVLSGDEGIGKTWAVLGWWLQKFAAEPNFPLTIVIPAKDISSADADDAIAKALFKSFRIRDERFWEERVRRWLASEAKTPNLLVIVDGLNQNWMFKDWSEFVLATAGAERRGKAALLLTVRPDFFRSRLKSFEDLSVKPEVISLGPFDNVELCDLLATYGLTLEEFDPKLLPLLRIPRLCHRAVRRRKELENSADITPERLVYEDWRDRQPAAQKAMNDSGFKEFLANLARRIKGNLLKTEITRKELLEELTLDSGDPAMNYEGVLSEIIDGRWLVATERQNQFKVHPDKLPYALGLDLVNELSGVASEQQARAVLDAAFDVYQGIDYGVGILRCASAFAMMESSVPELVRQSLLSYWLEAQNFGAADFDTFWKCVGTSPDSVLDVAEYAWFGRASRHNQDEVLVKAFSNAFKWAPVATACEARLTKWFEGYWLDPLVGEVIGNVPDDEYAQSRKSATQLRATEWSNSTGARTFNITIKEVVAENRAWGCYRAIEMMSWLPRKPLLRPITAWAVTRGIMGMGRQEEKFGWLLRWNEQDHDEAERVLLERASELASLGSVGVESASVLLKALATKQSETALDVLLQLPAEPGTPGLSNPKPEDPAQQHASDDYISKLRTNADSLTEEILRKELLQRPATATVNLRLALTRWVPESRRTLERRSIAIVLSEVSRAPTLTEEAQSMLPVLQRVIPLLQPEEVQQWKDAARRARELCLECNWKLQLGAFLGESASAQLDLLAHAPGKDSLRIVLPLLNPLDIEAACALKQQLDSSTPDESLLFWLEYLDFTMADSSVLKFAGLTDLFSHPSVSVREKVFEIALKDDSTSLADTLASSGWCSKQAASESEVALGSLLLAKSSLGADGALVDRVHPEVLGQLAEKFPDQEAYIFAFAEYVRLELYELHTAKSRTYPHALLMRHSGWGRLVNTRGEDLEQWLQPFLEKASRRLLSGWIDSFPLLEAIEAISHRNASLAMSVMIALLEDGAANGIRTGNLYSAALRLTSDQAHIVRQFVLQEANTDEKLYEFAAGLTKAGQAQKLCDQIDADMAAEMPGHIARGLTLAGFLMPSDEADELWRHIHSRVSSRGWLQTVKDAAQARYSRAKACFYWFNKFIATDLEDDAFMCFDLFLATVDPRFLDAGPWKIREPIGWPYLRRAHWGFHVDAINSASKKLIDEWKTVFLCTKPPLNNQHPTKK